MNKFLFLPYPNWTLSVLAAASFLVLSTSAYSITPNSDKASFDAITTWYHEATSLTFSEAEGVYEGSCFRIDGPDAAMNATLAITQIKNISLDNEADAPLAAKRVALENKVTLAYINFFSQENAIDMIHRNWASYEIGLEPSSFLLWKQAKSKGEVKKYKDSFVTLGHLTEDTTCLSQKVPASYCDDQGLLKSGHIFFACHFDQEL